MTGSPIGGLPWWGKAIYLTIAAPIAICCKIIEIKDKTVNKIRRKI